MSRVVVTMTVNGEEMTAETLVRSTLLDLIRDGYGLTGTHAGCEQGACGACSVMLDGKLVRSCLVVAVAAAGRSVTTIEGIGAPDSLSPIQRAMVDHHGLQCAFCTPGMVMSALDVLSRPGPLSEREVREALAGNLCRCTGYTGIISAVMEITERQAGPP
ncbi:MAG TPA: (2Fe-2S)-binding protein [Acidimicrobiales bacterium]